MSHVGRLPGLGKVVKQNVNVGVAAGINALGKEAELEGKKARIPAALCRWYGPYRPAQGRTDPAVVLRCVNP
jgi:hypothetical protein